MATPPPTQSEKVAQLKLWWQNLFPIAVNRMIKDEHINVVFHDATPILDQPPRDAFAKLLETASKVVEESNEK